MSKDKTNECIGYKIKINERITDKNNGQALNPGAIKFVPKKPLFSLPFDRYDDTKLDMADTDLLTHGESEMTCPLIDQPTRRSTRIAERRARQNMATDGQTSDTAADNRQPSLTSPDEIQYQDSTVDQTHNTIDKQISTGDTNETQPNQDDPTTNDILTTWAEKTTMDSEKTDDERTTEEITRMTSNPDITVDDYLTGEYFRPLYEYLTLDKLTGDNDIGRKIILVSENYYLKGNLMYKVTPTRGLKKNVSR